MHITKSYLTDETGKIQSVVLDYQIYQQMEHVLLDFGLMKAMDEIADEEEVDYEEVRELVKLL